MTEHPFEDLTRGEAELLRTTEAGELADLEGYPDAERVVRPALIRWLCERSHDRGIVATQGIRLWGAVVPGEIDLDNLDIQVPLWLLYCEIEVLKIRASAREINLSGSEFSAGIDAQGVRASRWFMRDAEVTGRLNFSGAVLEEQFVANGAHFAVGGDGYAIFASGVKATDWFMLGAEVTGRLDLSSAMLEGQFSANDARFTVVDDGEAIFASGVKASDWFMRDAEVKGQLDLSGAVLEGQFSLNGAHIAVAGDGGAIFASGMKASGWFMRLKCRVQGFVDLSAADIGHIDFDDAEIISEIDISVRLDAARCDDVLVGSGFSTSGAFLFDRAVISGVLQLRHAQLFACTSPRSGKRPFAETALSAAGAEIGHLVLPKDVGTAELPKLVGVIDLSHARIGTLEDFQAGWYPTLKAGWLFSPWERLDWPFRILGRDAAGRARDLQHIVLDGTVYEHLANPGGQREDPSMPIWKNRVHWLGSQSAHALTKRFNPQPWRQLARTLAAMGHEEDARQVTVQRRRAQRLVERSFFKRLVSWLLHVLANYGFGPWRTVGWCVVAILAFGGLYAWAAGCWWHCAAGTDALVFREFFATLAGDVLVEKQQGIYPAFNPWLFSLDQFIPILDLGMDAFWRPKSMFWYTISVIEQIVGALMIALMVTGFTGLLTRDEVG